YGVIKSAGLQKCKSFALFAPLVFDAGHSMIHSALLSGATLHVISDRLLTDGQELASYIHKHAIDCIKIVPSLWLTYADSGNTILAGKVMIFGGEGFTLSVLDRLVKSNYHGTVFNHYGPTEATIGKTIHKVDLQKQYNNIPIGKPFSNTQLYVLDSALNLLPVGVPGELHIAGDGLARGYLNREDLTMQKFIGDSFSNVPGAKMYKTGDQVRWLSDGNIEYLGRIDEQVKIRGFRIELGEIENVLLQSNLVSKAVVLAKGDAENKRLVAYVIPEEIFHKETAIAYLKAKLPEYMIPSLWIELKDFPLTPNGKIDKKAFPEPDVTGFLSNQFVAPRNDLEAKLAGIWKEILKVERVGVYDNFFELGGHSLLVMRLISSIKRELKIDLEISTLFELLTIEELANYIKVTQSNYQAEFENYDTIKL
ncbi:MAG: non-ribosomal peptide synthetase, partial [Ginsengibacter sp.]